MNVSCCLYKIELNIVGMYPTSWGFVCTGNIERYMKINGLTVECMNKLFYKDEFCWRIVKDGNFPSINYCVYNEGKLSPSDKLRFDDGMEEFEGLLAIILKIKDDVNANIAFIEKKS